jgi:hypothetical protein
MKVPHKDRWAMRMATLLVTLLLKLDGQEWRIVSLWLDTHTDYPRRRLTGF